MSFLRKCNFAFIISQTRYNDNNDGLTQGFFQEFHIFPGMESTTVPPTGTTTGGKADQVRDHISLSVSWLTERQYLIIEVRKPRSIRSFTLQQSNAVSRDAAAIAGKKSPAIPTEAIFGFAPQDTVFNPRKLGDVPDLKDRESNLVVPLNEVPRSRSKPVKKAFSPEKFEMIGENFQRTFDAL